MPNYFRKPFGPGWALVGDAGYNKDFITAQGIQDAFRDAELCATALDETFSGARCFDVAMGEYQSARDQHVLPMYEFTCELATLEPPPPELQQLLVGNARQPGSDGRVRAGQRRSDVAGRVLLGRKRRTHRRRGRGRAGEPNRDQPGATMTSRNPKTSIPAMPRRRIPETLMPSRATTACAELLARAGLIAAA